MMAGLSPVGSSTSSLDNDKPMKSCPSNSLSVQHLIFQREIIGQPFRNRNLKNLELLCEKNLIMKTHKQIICQLGPTPKSTFLMVFSPDGKIVASTHGDHNIYVSNVKTGACLHTLKGHPRTAWCIAFHPSSNDLIASGCLGGEVRIWDLKGSSEVWVSPKKNQIAAIAFHPTDSVLAIATDNKIYFWNWTLKEPFTSISTKFEKEKVKYVKFDALGYRLFTGIANIRSDGRECPSISSSSWRQPPSNLFGSEFSSSLEGRGSSYYPYERRPRASSINQPLIGLDVMLSDANSEDSFRMEEPRHSNRPSDESSSSSSSSLDSTSSMASGISQISEWNARLSLLWASRRNRAGNESDNSANSFEVEENEDSYRRSASGFSRVSQPNSNSTADNDSVGSVDHEVPGSNRTFNASDALPPTTATFPEPSSSFSYRHFQRATSRLSRAMYMTGFHNAPPLLGRSSSRYPASSRTTARNNRNSDGNAQSARNSTAASSRESQGDDVLDPLHGISLLSSHIENMQRICRSLDLARRSHSDLQNEHRDLSRLGQIRTMLIDIQGEIQSLRTTVDENNTAPPQIDVINYLDRPSVFHYHNYCARPLNQTPASQQEMRTSSDGINTHQTARMEDESLAEVAAIESRRRIHDSFAVDRIRQRRVEREGYRTFRRDAAMSELRRRIQLGPYTRYAELGGERSGPPGESAPTLFEDETLRNDWRACQSHQSGISRARTFSLNTETGQLPSLNSSMPDQRPNRLLDWERFARFRRLRTSGRATERSCTSLSDRISVMLQEQESTFHYVASDSPVNFGSGSSVNEPGTSSGRQHLDQLGRLRSFRLVMARLLDFVNELGSGVAQSRILAQATLDDFQGPPSDLELEAQRFRGNFREAYRLTLRSLILRIHNFIDNYLSDQGYGFITAPEMSEEAAEEDRQRGILNFDEHAHNLHLLVRLALLLIYQLISILSTQNILNDERPISRLPNPFLDVEGAPPPRSVGNELARGTLSGLTRDLGCLLEFVEMTTDYLLAHTNRESTSPGSSSSVAPSRPAPVPRPQRLDCRRLSRAGIRARNLLHFVSINERSPSEGREPEDTQSPPARQSAGLAPPAAAMNETLDMNSNYVTGGSASHESQRLLPLPRSQPLFSEAGSFGGVPLRILERQNAIDRRSPDAEEGDVPDNDAAISSINSRLFGHPDPSSAAQITDNRHNRQFDQFMFYRPSHSHSSSSSRHASGFNAYDYRSRPNQGVSNGIVNISSQMISHRIQIWDFNITNLPDISDRKKNVIVRRCKIHFDASIEISSDGTMLIALIPKAGDSCSVVICSLLQMNLGEVLYSHSVEANSVCVSLSPTMNHLVVGVGSVNNRLGILHNKQVVAFIFKLNNEKGILSIQRGIELCTDHRLIALNCIKWLPFPGTGFIYGTNRGQLTILH